MPDNRDATYEEFIRKTEGKVKPEKVRRILDANSEFLTGSLKSMIWGKISSWPKADCSMNWGWSAPMWSLIMKSALIP